jgi:hypothetical protein
LGLWQCGLGPTSKSENGEQEQETAHRCWPPTLLKLMISYVDGRKSRLFR